ncbi:prolyl oligopeptidase family serine peptidase [soil metagenome]
MKYNFSPGIISLFLLICSSFGGLAQSSDAFKKEIFVFEEDTLRYRIMYPDDFNESRQYPVVLFMHGAGERGNDNEGQLLHGSSLFYENQKNFSGIVIFPQAPKTDFWANIEIITEDGQRIFNFLSTEAPTRSLELLMTLMDGIVASKFVDQNRIYVGGLSMGAMGTFEILSRRPKMFAAAFAICGGADPSIVKNYPAQFNIWLFHGEQDNVVSPEFSKIMAREINSAGGNAKLSLYPNDNHNSWDSAFAEPFLLPWLFSHSKAR